MRAPDPDDDDDDDEVEVDADDADAINDDDDDDESLMILMMVLIMMMMMMMMMMMTHFTALSKVLPANSSWLDSNTRWQIASRKTTTEKQRQRRAPAPETSKNSNSQCDLRRFVLLVFWQALLIPWIAYPAPDLVGMLPLNFTRLTRHGTLEQQAIRVIPRFRRVLNSF